MHYVLAHLGPEVGGSLGCREEWLSLDVPVWACSLNWYSRRRFWGDSRRLFWYGILAESLCCNRPALFSSK